MKKVFSIRILWADITKRNALSELSHFWWKLFHKCFDRARYPPSRRVESWFLFHRNPRPNTHKKGRRTVRSIRTRSLRKIEIKVEESQLPLLRWKRISKRASGKNREILIKISSARAKKYDNAPDDKHKWQKSRNPQGNIKRSSQKVDFWKVEKTVNSLELMIRSDQNVRTDPLSVLVSPQVPENGKFLGTRKSWNENVFCMSCY